MSKPATVNLPASLEKAVTETGLTVDGIHSLRTAFAPHFIKFAEVREAAKGVPANAPKAARELRLELKAIRVAADKTREELKADSLRRGRAIDGVNAVLVYELMPIEKALKDIEDAEEIAEAKRKAALKASRSEQLQPYCRDISMYRLDECSEEAFLELLRVSKVVHETEVAATAKREADIILAEKAAREAQAKREKEAAETQAKLRAENERLAAVAAKERAAREESERVARLAAAEREAKARKEREAIEAKLKEERQKLAATEAAIKAKEDEIAKRVADEKAAQRKAAAAPDKHKLSAMAEAVRLISVPALTSDAGIALKNKISEQVAKFAAWLEAEASKL